ncbi:hypothetical protein DITRI_Ditri13aG0123600 [Diplodiscus trichospermus]
MPICFLRTQPHIDELAIHLGCYGHRLLRQVPDSRILGLDSANANSVALTPFLCPNSRVPVLVILTVTMSMEYTSKKNLTMSATHARIGPRFSLVFQYAKMRWRGSCMGTAVHPVKQVYLQQLEEVVMPNYHSLFPG